MTESSQSAGATRVSETTEPRNLARRLRSSIKLYRRTPVRGELITVTEAARRTGLGTVMLHQLIEDGQLDAHHALVVDAADLADEMDEALTERLTDLTERATGEAVTPDMFERLFGSREQRIARTRGEAVAS